MTTQEETITWHKYPNEKPENLTYCLATARYNNRYAWFAVIYKMGRWILQNNNNDDMELHKSWTVIAWAEPKGWQE